MKVTIKRRSDILTNKQYIVLGMREGNWTVPQIAKHLKISDQAVKSLLRRAKDQLETFA